MKYIATIFAISAPVLLCGCGNSPAMNSVSISSTTPTATPPSPKIAGNWQFSAAATVSGTPPVTIAGSIGQDGSVVSGVLHVNGSNCVDQLTAMTVTGTVNADSASLTGTGMDGQAVTITGNFTNTTFTGTYMIKGGCATGDQEKSPASTFLLSAFCGWEPSPIPRKKPSP